MIKDKVIIDSPDAQVAKAVEAKLVAILRDKPKGLPLNKVRFEIPQGPMLINGQWL